MVREGIKDGNWREWHPSHVMQKQAFLGGNLPAEGQQDWSPTLSFAVERHLGHVGWAWCEAVLHYLATLSFHRQSV